MKKISNDTSSGYFFSQLAELAHSLHCVCEFHSNSPRLAEKNPLADIHYLVLL